MSIRNDLLSGDISVVMDGLDNLDARLRKKEDHSDLLDVLLVLSGSHDPEIVQKTSWCAGKMGQNKVNNKHIISLLITLADHDDEQVRENVAWGIGETAGTVEMSDISIAVISSLLDDDDRDVRGMAAWAAGRFHHKCGHMTNEIKKKLETLSDDPSEYVRSAAKFALDDE
ncbi:MAG: HEAT repeat domain-containing protein [Methanomassiliicoccaceae archaeon]|jgi:HEAT repeat protein|nr:HEAT repeat domain-containing protein [Methanomassiliicoccaceae archaeon]